MCYIGAGWMNTEPIFSVCILWWWRRRRRRRRWRADRRTQKQKKGKFRSHIRIFDSIRVQYRIELIVFCQRTGNRFYVRYLDTHTCEFVRNWLRLHVSLGQCGDYYVLCWCMLCKGHDADLWRQTQAIDTYTMQIEMLRFVFVLSVFSPSNSKSHIILRLRFRSHH